MAQQVVKPVVQRILVGLAVLSLSACSGASRTSQPPTATTAAAAQPATSHTTSRSTTASHTQEGASPPSWLGTRALPKAADGFGEVRPTPPELRNRRFTLPDPFPAPPSSTFTSTIEPVGKDVLDRSTWEASCPVRPSELRYLTLTFWGFDDRSHTGELLVNGSATRDIVTAFRRLYDAKYPIEQMRITTKQDETRPPTGDGNNTGSFNCRPVRGSKILSQHAYGLAVDVNPFQNPYRKGDVVLPELASAYLKRDNRPGIIHDGDAVERAFAAVGWKWGGTWRSLKDYQHFSRNGR